MDSLLFDICTASGYKWNKEQACAITAVCDNKQPPHSKRGQKKQLNAA